MNRPHLQNLLLTLPGPVLRYTCAARLPEQCTDRGGASWEGCAGCQGTGEWQLPLMERVLPCPTCGGRGGWYVCEFLACPVADPEAVHGA